MVTWVYDGYMNGVARRRLDTNPGAGTTLADAAVQHHQVGFFASPGTVDANIITRVQYNVAHDYDPEDDGFGLAVNSHLNFDGTFTVTSDDIADLPGGTFEVTMAVYLVPASSFDEDHVPTPTEIIANTDTVSYRSLGGVTSPVVSSGGFGVEIPCTDLAPNSKYWALYCPVFALSSSPEPDDIVVPLGNPNTDGRAISFWTNRTPLAPVITSPPSGSLVPAGSEVTFSFRPRDPDALPPAPGDYRPWSFADLAGVQVQYAPRPSVEDPDPEWIDLPIAGTVVSEPTPGRGWFIEFADGTLDSDGAERLRDTKTMKILCGASYSRAGRGLLPSGTWQVRMRTFDYGHPMSTVRKTDDAIPGYGPLGTWKDGVSPETAGGGPWPDTDYTPDTYPAENTSPWSQPINITVTPQVPAPIPVTPINSIAVVEGTDVTLYWQYRNTYSPPFEQLQAQVQIRRSDEDDWTTLVSGNRSDHFYSIVDLEPNEADTPVSIDPQEYLTDGGFESGVAEWSTTATNGISQGSVNPLVGLHTLEIDAVTQVNPLVYKFIDLDPTHRFFTFRGWAYKGSSTDQQFVTLNFIDADDDSIDHDVLISITGPGPGWKEMSIENAPLPTGAVRVLITVTTSSNTSTHSGDKFDEFSFVGSPTSPAEIPPDLPALILPDQDPEPYTLEATTLYEWRVRVADHGHVTSDWSPVGRFWVVPPPGSGPSVVPSETVDGGTLGQGVHRVEVYRRGGTKRVGELTQLSHVDWGRLRDDISDAKIIISNWDIDCGNLLSKLQTWAYEIVIFRHNGASKDRVWEGPITLLTYENDKVTIYAKDVMAYLYRRIIKQEMNDSGSAGGDTVTSRAARVIQNVLAPDDPNLLQYLQVIASDSDAREYRNLPAWSRTAYEEIDDMAANSGLDYCAVGRAILLWGTKHRIGTLPEFRDEHLGSSPIVSEYGMSMANLYSVSDGNGVHGEADRLDEFGNDETYGLVEMLSSSWASDSEEESGTYTEEGLATVIESFEGYAERSISTRYPPPVVVRVPDNTTLNPNMPISIQHLVPGVAIPLRSISTLREVAATQKLDSIRVTDIKGVETVAVTMSPFSREDTAGEEPEA